MSDDHFEPVYGLPGFLPAGEKILWQGSPDWRSLAFRALRVREVMIYFAALIVLAVIRQVGASDPWSVALPRIALTAALGGAACAVLSIIAYLSARTTVYTVTNRRVAVRTGIAFTFTVNLPFALIDSVDLDPRGAQAGDVVLTLADGERVSYAMCWPSVRPWHYRSPQPMLRCLTEARGAGEVLARAIASSASAAVTVKRRVEPAAAPTHEPVAA